MHKYGSVNYMYFPPQVLTQFNEASFERGILPRGGGYFHMGAVHLHVELTQ